MSERERDLFIEVARDISEYCAEPAYITVLSSAHSAGDDGPLLNRIVFYITVAGADKTEQ